MVGHDVGQRDVGKRERQIRQQVGIDTAQAYHFAQGTADENKGVEGKDEEHRGHNDLSQVQPRAGIEQGVQLGERPQQFSQQGVTVYKESQVPLGQRAVDERVKARQSEVFKEVGRLLCMHEDICILTNQQKVEKGEVRHERC